MTRSAPSDAPVSRAIKGATLIQNGADPAAGRFLRGPFWVLTAAYTLISATTFSSLGVALNVMIPALDWSWAGAGLGYTLLALGVGLSSPLAGALARGVSVRAAYVIGAGVLAAAFAALSILTAVQAYWTALAAAGLGFALLANVPATYAIALALPEQRRNAWIGAYLAIGAGGGIAGPWIANIALGALPDWRLYWVIAAATTVVLGGVCAIMLPSRRRTPGDERDAHTPTSSRSWRRHLITPAFWAGAGALTLVYWILPTVSNWLPVYKGDDPVAAAWAVTALSVIGAVNASARVLGGWISARVSPEALTLSAMVAAACAMMILPSADGALSLMVFGALAGYAFGMTMFAVSAFVLARFGRRDSGVVLGAMNGAATIAVLGPVTAGWVRDRGGSLDAVFLATSAAALVMAAAFALMTLRPRPGGRP